MRAAGALLLILLAGCARGDIEADAETVVLATHGAGYPTAAAAGSGVSYVAWVQARDSLSDVYLGRVDVGDAAEPVRVNDIAGDAAPHEQAPPQVAVGPDGAVYVVWQNNRQIPGRRFPASNLRFARSVDGGLTFEPAIFVNDDAEGPPSSHTFQDIAVGADGTIYVSWIDGRERTRAEMAQPAVSAGHSDHASNMPGSQVRVAKSTDGGRTFTSGAVVYDNVCPCCRTSLAVLGKRVAVAFRSADRNIRDILVAQSADAGDTFGQPTRVHSDGWQVEACPHAGASVAFDAAGRLHVAWYTGAEERQGLWYTRSSEGASGFDAPQPIHVGGWVPVSQVKLAVDASGVVWIAWDDRREQDSIVRVSRVRDGRVETLRTTFAGQSPALHAGADVILAWQHADSAAARVLRRRG